MADILIRGMEMPDGCHHCRFSYLDKGETNGGEPCSVIMCSAMEQGTNGAEYDGNRPFWCPLVPLPAGHGRLGDLDALQEEFKKTHDGKRLMLIDTAPTIVPAEGGTDNG
jgi:hypothetical protein